MNPSLRITLIAVAAILCLAFPVAATCSDGDGCTCNECNVAGYSYWCAANQNCYSHDFTCGFECSGSCTATTNCSLPVACSASQDAACSAGQECCLDSDANPFCAAAGNVCCNYAQMTCTNGTVCDAPTKSCVTPTSNYSTECKQCMSFVSKIETDGCVDADTYCALLPVPFNAMCLYLMKAGLCEKIVQYLAGDLTPVTICEMIPLLNLCASGLTCECGYCQPAMYGNWCLALDATCPSSHDDRVARKTNVSSRHDGGRNICFDGMCDESNAGCCLTCAP